MTGNIVGEPIESYVKDQIKVRQQLYGSGFLGEQRTPEQLNYFNSKLSWVKMASSVEILRTKGKKIELYGEEIGTPTIPGGEDRLPRGLNSDSFLGQELAKKAILFNGLSALKSNKTYQNRSGVSTTDSVWNLDKAYGLGGSEFGLQPMPGITSVNIEHLNRGSIRKATVTLKVFNTKQFEIIELLYLRLGFTMMIEWGNNTYFNNNNEKENIVNTLIENFWFKNKESSHLKVLNRIEKERQNHSGNYDAFFGRVVNFSWNFQSDGSYDITIELASLGDVIESIKVNTLIPVDLYEKEEDSNKNINSIINFLTTLQVGSEITTLENVIVENPQNGNLKHHVRERIEELKKIQKDNIEKGGDKIPEEENIGDFLREVINIDSITTEKTKEFKGILNYPIADPNKGYYIRLGAFLNFLQDYILPVIKNGNTSFPLINIKNDPLSSLMGAETFQFSIDPGVCLVRNDYLPSFTNETVIQKKPTSPERIVKNTTGTNIQQLFRFFKPWCSTNDEILVGRIMNVYLNFDFLINQVNSNVDSKGNLYLYKFLETICNNINKSLGGINNLQPVVDESSNSITIIETNQIKGKEKITDQDSGPLFEIFGYNPISGSSNFVKSFSLQTEITPELATTLTIGATANGQVVGEDATAFSKWNRGLIDRFNQKVIEPSEYIPEKKPKPSNVDQALSGKISPTELTYREKQELRIQREKKAREKALKDKEIFRKTNLQGYLVEAFAGAYNYPANKGTGEINITGKQAAYFQFKSEFIQRGLNILKNYYNIEAEKNLKNKQTPSSSVGFIPINLSLEIEGLSGIKIYNKLIINTKYLPGNYPEALEFLVKKVNHSLQDNKWITKLETISIPKVE
jgi:hypothetical protein